MGSTLYRFHCMNISNGQLLFFTIDETQQVTRFRPYIVSALLIDFIFFVTKMQFIWVCCLSSVVFQLLTPFCLNGFKVSIRPKGCFKFSLSL